MKKQTNWTNEKVNKLTNKNVHLLRNKENMKKQWRNEVHAKWFFLEKGYEWFLACASAALRKAFFAWSYDFPTLNDVPK